MAFEVKYELKKPTHTTLRRFSEIQFYYIYNSLSSKAPHDKIVAYLSSIADMFDMDKTILNIAANMLRRVGFKPTKKERMLMYRIQGLSYAQINKLEAFDLRTLTQYIKAYIDKGQPDMLPTLQLRFHEFLVEFNQHYVDLQVVEKEYVMAMVDLDAPLREE